MNRNSAMPTTVISPSLSLAPTSIPDFVYGTDVVATPEETDALPTSDATKTDAVGIDSPGNFLFGLVENDGLYGGAENDTLEGSNDDDRIVGRDGDDSIVAGLGNDVLVGDKGHDFLDAGWGDDTINGGSGSDTIRGGWGDDTINGGDDNDRIDGAWGDDTINGGSGNDTIGAAWGDDVLLGGEGDDYLDGGWDDDRLYGGDGDDHLVGSYGRDILQGGAGGDTFEFSVLEFADGDIDVIHGIDGVGVEGGDVIDLQKIDANTLIDDDQAFVFLGELTREEGRAAGPGALWVQDFGNQTRVFGVVDDDKIIDFSVRINDGAEVAASDYIASDFLL